MNPTLNPVLSQCADCPWNQEDPTGKKLAHHRHRHHGEALPAQPVSGANWREQAADAVRQVAARGKDFTFYEALAEFGLADPPNAKSAVGSLATWLHDTRAVHPVGYAPSQRGATKGSAAKVWNRDGRRCIEPRCRARVVAS